MKHKDKIKTVFAIFSIIFVVFLIAKTIDAYNRGAFA